MTPYFPVFSRQALDFVAASDDDVFVEIDAWVSKIERAPSTPGDYTEKDHDGRDLHVVVMHHVAITCWPDHAPREVRIIQIEANRDRRRI